jgi:putative SOS response-associated peptidase YedK
MQMSMDGFFPGASVMQGDVRFSTAADMSLPGSPSGKHGKAPRIRHRFTRADSRMLVMAGLYWTFRLSSMENLTAFTILTVDANADVSPIHDRMPLILEEQDLRAWLTAGISDDVAALLVPSVQGTLRREVSAAG